MSFFAVTEGFLAKYLGGRYEPIEKSVYLPDLDLAVVASLSTAADQHTAVRTFRDLLRSRG